jgi:hypothetical protein
MQAHAPRMRPRGQCWRSRNWQRRGGVDGFTWQRRATWCAIGGRSEAWLTLPRAVAHHPQPRPQQWHLLSHVTPFITTNTTRLPLIKSSVSRTLSHEPPPLLLLCCAHWWGLVGPWPGCSQGPWARCLAATQHLAAGGAPPPPFARSLALSLLEHSNPSSPKSAASCPALSPLFLFDAAKPAHPFSVQLQGVSALLSTVVWPGKTLGPDAALPAHLATGGNPSSCNCLAYWAMRFKWAKTRSLTHCLLWGSYAP